MSINKIFKKIPKEFKDGVPLYEKIRKKMIDFEKINVIKLSNEYKKFENEIKKYKGIHKGKRCFIIGSGPSLNKTNLELLKKEIVIGVNDLYKIKSIDFKYFVVCSGPFFQKHTEDLFKLNCPLFLPTKAGIIFLKNIEKYKKNLKKLDIVPIRWKGFNNVSKNIVDGTYNGGTVINQCLQIANYMGFKETYLLGCDCDFSGKLHFDESEPLVFDKMVKENDWSIPFNMYNLNKKLFEEQGKKIYNSTVGGKLEIFERKKLEEVLR